MNICLIYKLVISQTLMRDSADVEEDAEKSGRRARHLVSWNEIITLLLDIFSTIKLSHVNV